VRVAFDSRPGASSRGVGHYARCLLEALRDIAGEHDEILETHRPRRAEVFHAPWMEGAMLHSPCPMVVTVHDLGVLRRPSERLRGGGVHLRLRQLALQRATHVIVPTEVLAHEAVAELGFERERVVVIPEAPVIAEASVVPVAPDPASLHASDPRDCAPTNWTWQDAGRETWRVYESALARPERPCVGRLSRRLAERTPRGPSSAGL
jgi:Glycosyltransferase Family 4